LLTEYGEVMPQGRAGIRRDIPAALGRVAARLPAVVIDSLREQYARVGQLDEQVQEIERRLRQWHSQDDASRRIAEIPGAGLLTATAAIATMGDPKVFKSGREFAACSGWCRGKPAPADACGCSASASAVIRTFEPC
jgi:transposase